MQGDLLDPFQDCFQVLCWLCYRCSVVGWLVLGTFPLSGAAEPHVQLQ